jgi:hypothetical protein
MLSPVILAIPTLVLPLVLAPPADCQHERFGNPAQDERALAMFDLAVEDYAALHRRLERVWPPEALFTNPEQREMEAEGLRTALRDARPLAKPGGIFTPEVADVFRVRIASAIRDGEYNLDVVAWPAGEGEDAGAWIPEVNQPIPWGVSAVRWPSLAMLPSLPTELAYRFIGRDLVLVDLHANLVVDVLELALPARLPAAEPMGPPPEEDFIGCRPE